MKFNEITFLSVLRLVSENCRLLYGQHGDVRASLSIGGTLITYRVEVR